MNSFNMPRFFLILGIFLFLPSSSAMKVISVTKIPKEIKTQMGSRLLIPCRFNTDATTYDGKMEMEWMRVPFKGGPVKPLVHVYNQEILEYFDSRAHVFLNILRRGNCSLVIDPVLQEDEGYFQLHLKANGKSYEPFPFLSVRVSENNGQKNEANNEKEDRGLLDVKKKTIQNFFAHPDMKGRQTFKAMMISAGVFLLLSIIGSVGVSIYLTLKRRTKKRQDELGLVEEGCADPGSN